MRSEVIKEIFSRLSPRQTPLGNTYFADVKSKLDIGECRPDEFRNCIDSFLESEEVISTILNPMLLKNRKIVEGEVKRIPAVPKNS